MEMLRAFVGHSFTEQDAAVVGKFLKYLAVISELNSSFSWEHAEAPEPEMVDTKVLARFEGKNLFIGICTRKEQVIDSGALKPHWFLPKGHLRATENDLKWKPSDWVIQEIGLAVGRHMKIILLLEDGVRAPGALQGNLEYIPFQREAPEKCFDKLLGMIASLAPDRAVEVVTTSDQAKPDNETQGGVPSSGFDLEPNAEWKSPNWEFALMHCIAMDDCAMEGKLTEAYFRSYFGSNDVDKDEWLATREYYKIYFGMKGSLATLLQLADKRACSVKIATYVAKSYQSYDEFSKAAEIFKATAEKALSDADRIELLGQAALSFHKAGQEKAAGEMLDTLRKLNNGDDEIEGRILGWERSLAEVKDDHHRSLGAMERQLELEPGDADVRFSLAYKYSEVDNQDALSLLHYTRIPWGERTAIAWNNLGWAYECLGLPIKSVVAYREAECRTSHASYLRRVSGMKPPESLRTLSRLRNTTNQWTRP